MSAGDTVRNAILQQTEKLSTFEVTLLLIFTLWRTCSVLKNIDLSGLRLWNAEVHLNQMTEQNCFEMCCTLH